ncbi:ABC transporter permease [Motiliproteus sediminis]|uniref:ABC transporter permease n=1 Tax=Motiliproteus sediminis TaxID=1468178 RepID=UPI001AEFF915|nr:ABC transporter permease [Motiliproteus sediminis]
MATVPEITLWQLLIALLPVIPVAWIYWRWQLGAGRIGYALVRMLGQLLLIGYLLTFIFDLTQPLWLVGIVLVMLSASSWIALGSVEAERRRLLLPALIAIGVGGGINLAVALLGVLQIDPWYQPRYLIPLAGMVFSNAMNSVSLAADRITSEVAAGQAFERARQAAFKAAMIPSVNMLLAVGLVSLPGMMTGQILSGVSPLIAARYQILIMCMLLSASGLSVVLFLSLARRYYQARIAAPAATD